MDPMTRAPFMIIAILLADCSGSSDSTGPGNPVALVSLGRAERGPVTERVRLFGVAEPGVGGRQALAAAADAIVVRIVAPVGTRVARGDLIVVLSPAPATRLDGAKARADARAADTALARAKRLRLDGLISDGEVETARATAANAQATLASLSTRSAALAVRAQGSGYVESISVSPGELVATGAAIATISQPGNVRARFGADPALAERLHVGARIRFIPDSQAIPLDVPITSINLAADPQTRLASIYASLPAGSGISIGETLQALVDVGGINEGITIPYAALLDDGGQPYIFTVNGGVAHRRDVMIGPASGERIAILKGVAPGDRVVTEGGTAIEDGMMVRTK